MNEQVRKSLRLLSLLVFTAALSAHDSDRWPLRESETIQKTFNLSGDPMRVVVDNVDGFVHVSGTDGSQVRLTAHKRIHAESDADLSDAKNEVRLELTEKPGTVSIYYDAPWRCNGERRGCNDSHRRFYNVTYDIEVEVPREARIVVSTVNNGDIRIENTRGDFDIGDVNGGITMNEVAGSGEVHTVNGPVTVRFTRNPEAPTSFKSLNGQMDIYFRPSLSADLLFKTFNGQIYSDFEVAPRAIPAAEAQRQDSKFVYSSRGFSGGRAGKGGPELKFDAFNGDIRLHQANR